LHQLWCWMRCQQHFKLATNAKAYPSWVSKSNCQNGKSNWIWEIRLPIETKRIRMNEQDQAVVDGQSQELVAQAARKG
jgi:hypothetical protein